MVWGMFKACFSGRIFFTALLILLQSPEAFKQNLLQLRINGNLSIAVSQRIVIAFPLTVTIILFVFSSIFMAISCSAPKIENCDRMADDATNLFFGGFFSFYVSLFVLVAFVDILVAVMAITLSVALLIWWGRTIKKKTGMIRLTFPNENVEFNELF